MDIDFETETISDVFLNLKQGGMQSTDLSLENFLTSPSGALPANTSTSEIVENSEAPTISGQSTASFVTGSAGVAQNIMFQLTSGGQYQLDPATILLGTSLSQGSQPTFTLVPAGLYGNIQNIVNTSVGTSLKSIATPTAMSSSDLLTQLLQQQQQSLEVPKKHHQQQSSTPIQPAPSLNQHHQSQQQQHIFRPSSTSQTPVLAQSLSIQQKLQQQQQPQAVVQPNHTQQRKPSQINKLNKQLGSNDSISAPAISSGQTKAPASSNQKKKDGPFAVPTVRALKSFIST